MSKVKIFLFLQFIFFSALPVLAQVDTAWVRRYNGPGNSSDYAYALALDSSGNLYVTGQSVGSGTGYDYATIKYSSAGETLWVRRYNGPGNDFDRASALALDSSGNLYVTGYSTGSGGNVDYATIKYSSAGDTLWVRRYNGPGNSSDYANALVLDSSGNLYVTGQSTGSGGNWDYATIKYSPAGGTLWVRRYNGPGNGYDNASALALDGSGNLYVTGYSTGSGTNFDYATIKYSSAGETLWVRRYNGPGNYSDAAFALALDGSGNLYVTGGSNGSGTGQDYATIKYSPAGETLWVRRYNVGGDDYASALALDSSGNLYVTGSGYDYATIKYSSAGETLWVRRYNGPGNSSDNASALALDSSGNLYVTGQSVGSGTVYDYATIKYSSAGETLWVRRYNGPPGNGYDLASALALDSSGNLYVTGSSDGSGTFSDYATIKYVQYDCLAKPGDVTGDGNILLADIIALINYRFKSGPTPSPFCRGDANGDGSILLADIIYLINRVFKSGPAPLKSKECCL